MADVKKDFSTNLKSEYRKTRRVVILLLVVAIVCVSFVLLHSHRRIAEGEDRLDGQLRINFTEITIAAKKHVDKKANYYKACLYGTGEYARCLDTVYGEKSLTFKDLIPGETYFVKLAECQNNGGYITENKESAYFTAITPVAAGKAYMSGKKEVEDMLIKAALAHEENEITFYYPDAGMQEDFTVDDLYVDDEICAVAYSWIGQSEVNDYGQRFKVLGRPYRKYVYEFEFVYTKKQQETYISKIKKIADSLEGGPADKVKKLDDYLRANCEYDYTLTKFDPYDLIVGGKAVCDGYARAAYFILNLAGVRCEYIYGDGFGGTYWESHAWNIVKVKDKWYYCDFTWDGTLDSREYLLRGEASGFSETHIPEGQFQTKQWQSAHPMSKEDY